MSMIRTRWAALGAAVAVTLGAGGIGLVDAAKTSGDRPVTITIEPCRLRDTRPDKAVGGRTTPLGPSEAYTIKGTGPSGNCNIPTDATGLVLNVTADQATEATNLRLYPTGGAIPTTSNLNPRPGAPPTPNAVTVGLNGSGRFDIRNAKGNVHVIIDVTAYLVHHTHDDRYYTKDQVDALLDGQASGSEAAFTYESSASGDGVAAEVTVDTPTFGYVIVNASASAQNTFVIGEGQVVCSITSGNVLDSQHFFNSATLNPVEYDVISSTRAFRISAVPLNGERTYRLVCDNSEGNIQADLANVHLNATFVPDADARTLPTPP